MKKSIRVLAALILAVMLMVSTYSFAVLAYVPAAYPQPAYDNRPPDLNDTPPVIDGDPGEWYLAEDGSGDFFADMIRAGGQGDQTDVESKLYLRYDCSTNTLFALVLGEPNVPVLVEGTDETKSPPEYIGRDNAHIKVRPYDSSSPSDWFKLVDGDSGNDGTPPDFEWIYERDSIIDDFDDDGRIADGWEASAPLAEGSWDLNVHTQVWHGGESQTSAVKGRNIDLVITCDETAIALPSASFTAQAGAGSVTLAWETGTELDNAGFNLYRAMLKDGPYTQINDALIAAQGDAVSGAGYSFLDAPDYGTFYYQLEDVDYYGTSTLHGPVKVTVARPLRRPLYRPRLPEF
ncbi:MAG: hypothetical protein E3J21_05110 [Anaerolineales bacterium]|nr:MAG: hypothetical protein E3J21_05110 [Anaerolineales bacterium]